MPETKYKAAQMKPRISQVFALICVICAICGFLLLASCGRGGDSWERIWESGVLRVGVDPTFPPFALAEGDAVEGIDIDLARALAEELGLEVRFSYFGYDGLYDALTTGQVDALISALVIVPERTKEIAYSAAYFDAGQFLVAGASSGITRMADLGGRTLAVELGALGHVEALNWEGRLSDLTVETFGSAAEALGAVVSGAADAALVDSVGGRLFLGSLPISQSPDLPIASDSTNETRRLVQLPTPVISEPFAVAVRIDDRVLREEINAALARLDESGELETIIGRWLD